MLNSLAGDFIPRSHSPAATAISDEVRVNASCRLVASATAPMVFYWHGTGSRSSEFGLMAGAVRSGVESEGGVLVFAGLTAYDTQRLNNDYIYGYASERGEIAERAAITGALSLYLNFINLFTLLLQLLGQREE